MTKMKKKKKKMDKTLSQQKNIVIVKYVHG